jgi:hypothetical protein
MHPDLLSVLARARQEDLLRQHEFRERSRRARSRPHTLSPRSFRPILRARLRAGTLLIRAGSRLRQPRRADLDLIHK